MRKILIILNLCWMSVIGLGAQELRCSVSINTDKIEGTNKQVFETMKAAIEDYMNNNRWTNMTYAEHEKIECSLLIVVNSAVENMYNCSMTLQSRRPVYGTSYSTPILNLQDGAFNFTYEEYDRIEYQQNQFTTNLTAMLAFYCYLIIGHDQDTYQRLGGSPFFEQCELIVNACQSATMDNLEQKGWRAFEDNRNRYALTNNLMDEAFRKYREFYYTYHRLGLDEMTANMTNARARIAEGLPVLREVYRARPATYLVSTFLDAKNEEIVDIFNKGTAQEKKTVYDVLMDIDPTRQETYDKIN